MSSLGSYKNNYTHHTTTHIIFGIMQEQLCMSPLEICKDNYAHHKSLMHQLLKAKTKDDVEFLFDQLQIINNENIDSKKFCFIIIN